MGSGGGRAAFAVSKRQEHVLNADETGSEARPGIGEWISYYNGIRPHSSLDDLTSDEVFHEGIPAQKQQCQLAA